MTARIIRQRPGRESWQHFFWRLLLLAAALLLVWLLLARATAAQQRQPRLPREQPLGQFDPTKILDQLFGGKGGELNDEARLAKVVIPWDEEQRLGEQGLDELKQRLAAKNETLAERGRDVEYLQRLAGLIQPQMQQAQRYRRLRVAVASLKTPEAYVLPGGRLFVSQGMLESAGCEAALVGVLGHELSHLDRGHLLRRMKQWKLAQQQFSQPAAGFTPDRLLGTMSTMQQLFRRPFGPQEELDADSDGILWTYRAGYDPRALTDVYAAFEKHGLDAPDFLPAFLRTHPPSAERRENLQTVFAQLHKGKAADKLYLGRENLQRRLTRQQREFAE
jgi:predicted Zn-dependent protease